MKESAPIYFKIMLQFPLPEDLLELFEQAKANPDQICCLSWLAEGPINPRLVLTAIAYRNERTDWHGQNSLGIEPEWQLELDEDGPVRKKIWGGLKTSDLALVASLIPRLDKSSPEPPPEPFSKIALPFPDQTHEKWTGSLLGRSVATRVKEAIENQKEERSATVERGMVLTGNVKDTNVLDILQSINFCKMTGKLKAFDIDRFFELYIRDGEVVHARAAHALLKTGRELEGENALLDFFCWEEGRFDFEPGLTTEERSLNCSVQGILMEGAMLRDYRSFLKKKNLSRKSHLTIAPDKMHISESEFDKILLDGLDVHVDLQKKIFLDLRTAQPLEQVIRKYDMNNLVWIPVFFNLLNLGLIVILPA